MFIPLKRFFLNIYCYFILIIIMEEDLLKILNSLKRSKFRSRFKLGEKDYKYIQEKGMETIRTHAFDFITTRVASEFPENDGKQTPMNNHPVFIAQHATATCCRGCINKWHSISKGKELNNKEIQYIINLIMKWIELQVNRLENNISKKS